MNRILASLKSSEERAEMRNGHKNGRQVSIRNLSAGDEPGLRDMFGRLSGGTIYKRFHMPFPRVPDSMLAHLMGHGGGRSLVAVAGDDIVGHALYAEETGGRAEVALVVEDGWQSMGIGKLLLAGLAREAAGRGVETFTAVALGENRRVLALVDAVFAGARHKPRDGSYDITMPLRGLRPAPQSGREIRPAA
jgi:GNAT superfamily N-acetyltransferase